jgi:predicted phage terminase large subunit-like protein
MAGEPADGDWAAWVHAHTQARLEGPRAIASWCDPSFLSPPHITYASDQIRDAVLRGNGRIMVLMPPRHGKSTLCSIWTPLWLLSLRPWARVILASYAAEIASRFGRLARSLVLEHPDKLGIKLAEDSAAAHRWNTTEGGGMLSVGVGGPLTGFGANLVIIDDPVQNDEEARSKVYRERAWEWYQATLSTRLEPRASILFVMTRWHEDDLAGRILAREKDRWLVIRFPAIAETADAIGRAPGDVLWPERYGHDEIQQTRAYLSAYWWSALYQQRPTPDGGGMFRREHFRYFHRMSDGGYVINDECGRRVYHDTGLAWFQVCDTAMKTKTTNDWTVVSTIATTPEREMLLVDVQRVRLEVPDQLPFLRAQARKWRLVRRQYVEDRASGTGLLQTAAREGVPLVPVEAETDKVNRASSLSNWYRAGRVYHLAGAPWLADYEEELLRFPLGEHDDQVDTAAYAARLLEMSGEWLYPVAAFKERDERHPEDCEERGWRGIMDRYVGVLRPRP